MEDIAAISHAPAAPVLGYEAIQRRRWERGVFWLAGIVCASQLLTAPFHAWLWFDFVHRAPAPSYLMRTDCYTILIILSRAASVAVVVCSFLLLLRRTGARAALMLCTCVLILLSAVEHFQVVRNTTIYWPGDSITMATLAQASDWILWSYPPLLLSAVVWRREAKRRQLGAAVIWWMTAAAAMVVALPTVWQWITRFEPTWVKHVTTVFAVFGAGRWWRSIAGVGMMAGSVACFSTFAAVVWTLFRGASGRWALMICAALWVVYGAACFGTYIGEEIASGVLAYRVGFYLGVEAECGEIARQLQLLAGGLAFPLAIRVALTLSDVRARLEGE